MLYCDFYSGRYLTSNIVLRNLTLNFQGQTFLVAVLTNKNLKKTNITIILDSKLCIYHLIASYQCYTSQPWPTFSGTQNWKCWFLENGESCEKLSNGSVANVILRDLVLNFKDRNISRMVKVIEKNSSYDFDRGWHSPSNGTVVNVVLRDLDLHFQRSNIFMLSMLKNRK